MCLLVWSQTQLFPLAIAGIVLCAFISYDDDPLGAVRARPVRHGRHGHRPASPSTTGAVTAPFGLSIVIGFLGYFNAFVVLAIAALVTMAFMLAAVAPA